MLHATPEATARPYVGGQAIIEGVFMRAPRALAMAVRTPSGEIRTQARPYTPFFARHKFFKFPGIRGAFVMIDALVVGMKALSWSAEQAALEDGDDGDDGKASTSEPERPPLKDRLALGGTMAFSLVLGLGLFVALPHLLTDGLGWLTGTDLDVEGSAFHVVDGAVKLCIFLAYIALIRRSQEILRVFAYHGAEHKTIFAYEAGLPLELATVRQQSRFHPRCGTSFILFVVGISILVFAAVFPLLPELPIEHRLLKNLAQVGIKIPLTLPVAAFSYEIIRASSKFYNKAAFFRWMAIPGLALQRLTTEEPDDDQLEVAITALASAVEVEEGLGGGDLGLEGAVFDMSAPGS
jgi:uncharacterized protein YqhQ